MTDSEKLDAIRKLLEPKRTYSTWVERADRLRSEAGVLFEPGGIIRVTPEKTANLTRLNVQFYEIIVSMQKVIETLAQVRTSD